jgi:phage terminase large subunit-like protein
MEAWQIEYERLVSGLTITDDVLLYCSQVANGEIRACKKIKLACLRHLLDLSRQEDEDFPYYYDSEAGDRVVRFARKLCHWEGDWAGQPFEPLLWQRFLLCVLFGWKRKSDHKRRFRYAYVEVPRKNGKSFLASVVGLYMLIADREEGAQVYAAATKRDQAKIVWDAACKIASKSKIRQTSLHWLSLRVKATNSRFEPLASDSEKLDGLNPHCAILDELHEWPDRALWDVIEDAFGARSQPLMFVITTAGYNKHGICYQQRTHGVSILDGAMSRKYCDDTYFVFIADMDESVRIKKDGTSETYYDWQNEDRWYEANPCLGAAKNVDYMRDQCNKASLMPGKENAFLNKQLDVWTEVEKRWLDMARWDACDGLVEREKLHRQKCYAGIDLSSNTDITAVVLLFPPGPYPEWTVLPFFFLPEDNLKRAARRDRVPYLEWKKTGLLLTTPGDIIDLEFIREFIIKLGEEFSIVEIGFDPWKAVEIATKLQTEGFEMVQMRQGHATLGPPTSDLEKKVLKKELRHGGHPILRWMAGNTTVIRDSNDNIRPDKGGEGDGKTKKQRNRIDGIVALIMALGRGLFGKPIKKSKYEDRGLIAY